ncbi:hypothetical protein VN97_g6011 [Penicillium thymicola]|uniref:Uncharacterized protein n=1 Tax=Penicillium thymicola TaxID=293382 RepID=A0AAI9X7W8_PENTH|nr:hypothetical protein VN97_g6011 [Penicillium thymicola]
MSEIYYPAFRSVYICLHHDALFPKDGCAITNILIMLEIHKYQNVVSQVTQGTPRPAHGKVMRKITGSLLDTAYAFNSSKTSPPPAPNPLIRTPFSLPWNS